MATETTIPFQSISESFSFVFASRRLIELNRSIDIIAIDKATNIHGSRFDSPSHPIAVNGTLDKSITPATYIPFASLINSTHLARFGLHNGAHSTESVLA